MREPNEQKTISIVEVRSLRCPPAKHIDLLPQDQDFCCQLCSRLEERSQDAENQLEQIGHRAASLPRPLAASTLNLIFGTHNGANVNLLCQWRQVADHHVVDHAPPQRRHLVAHGKLLSDGLHERAILTDRTTAATSL